MFGIVGRSSMQPPLWKALVAAFVNVAKACPKEHLATLSPPSHYADYGRIAHGTVKLPAE
jgi:hypothetical protein